MKHERVRIRQRPTRDMHVCMYRCVVAWFVHFCISRKDREHFADAMAAFAPMFCYSQCSQDVSCVVHNTALSAGRFRVITGLSANWPAVVFQTFSFLPWQATCSWRSLFQWRFWSLESACDIDDALRRRYRRILSTGVFKIIAATTATYVNPNTPIKFWNHEATCSREIFYQF